MPSFRIHSIAAALLLGALAIGCTTGSGDDGTEPVDRTAYPEGPFGIAEGNAIENHLFLQPNGEDLDFQSIRSDENAALLLLSTAAGWCTACIEEQGFLESQYNDRQADGLVVLVSVFEDQAFQPADADLAANWVESYDVTFPVVADPEFVLSAYYDESVTPMNMLVDLDTMEILHIVTGTDQTAIEALIESSL